MSYGQNKKMETKTASQINTELQWVDAQRNDGTWKPEGEGDFLQGEYVGFEETNTGKKIYTIFNGDGEEVKLWGGKIIDSYFNHKTGVNAGEMVRITFLGRVPIEGKFNDKGEPAYYNDYKVRHTLGKRPQSQLPETAKENSKKVEEDQDANLFPEDEKIDPKKIPF